MELVLDVGHLVLMEVVVWYYFKLLVYKDEYEVVWFYMNGDFLK